MPIEPQLFFAGSRDPPAAFTVGFRSDSYRSARQELFEQSATLDGVYVMAEGWAARCKQLYDGHQQILAILLPGDCLNTSPGMAALDHSIVALTPVRLARIPHAKAIADDGLAAALWRSQVREAAILRQWLTNLGQRDARQRIAHFLCEVFVRAAERGLGNARGCEFPLTQQDLAHVMGLTPVHVNRMLQQLRHEGLIDLRAKRLSLPDFPRLRCVADFDPSYLRQDDGEAG